MSNRLSNGGAAAARSSKTPAAPAVKGSRASVVPTSSAVRGGRASGAAAPKNGRDSGATVAKSGRNSMTTEAKSDRDSAATVAKSGRNSMTTEAKSSRESAVTVAKSGSNPAPTTTTTKGGREPGATGVDATATPPPPATCGPPCCVPNGCAKPEGHYACDRQEAKALAQWVTPDERAKVMRWLDALRRLNDRRGAAAANEDGDGDEEAAADVDEQSERSMYMTCLLMLLRSGRLVAPFTRSPPAPPRPLQPLRDVVDRRLYRRVQAECRRRGQHERVRYARPGDSDADDDGRAAAARGAAGFFDSMPEPCGGVLCYGAVFSDMS